MTDEAGNWWELAFRSAYLDVYAHRDADSARREVRGLVDLGLTGRVLDLCCGAGRHALALGELGLDVVGIDQSADLLAAAVRASAGTRVSGRLLRGDVRALPFVSGSFDSLACLFNSLGYSDEAGNQLAFREISRILKPRGRAYLDLMNAARLRSTLVPESDREVRGRRVRESRRLTTDGQRVVKEVRVTGGVQPEARWTESVRLYEPDELSSLLASSGLEVERVCGEFDGRPFDVHAPRMLVLARRGT